MQVKTPTPATRQRARRLMARFTPVILQKIAERSGESIDDVDNIIYEFADLSVHIETDQIETVYIDDTDSTLIHKSVKFIETPLSKIAPFENALRQARSPIDRALGPTPPQDITSDEKKDDTSSNN